MSRLFEYPQKRHTAQGDMVLNPRIKILSRHCDLHANIVACVMRHLRGPDWSSWEHEKEIKFAKRNFTKRLRTTFLEGRVLGDIGEQGEAFHTWDELIDAGRRVAEDGRVPQHFRDSLEYFVSYLDNTRQHDPLPDMWITEEEAEAILQEVPA